MVLVVHGYLGKKVFKEINGSWCYHEFKGPVLVIKNEKSKGIFLLARVCKQVIWNSTVYAIYTQLPLRIERSLIWRLIPFCKLLNFLIMSR